MSKQIDRLYQLYRRRISRCRTENQLNKLQIALENYLTPAEARHLRVAAACEPLDSPSRRWAARLEGFFPIGNARPVEFQRRGIFKGMTLYTADVGSTARKSLIIGFAGHFHRLMLPMPWLLDCLNPAAYDVIVLRDFSRTRFALGIPGLGGTFFDVLANLPRHVDPRWYRNAIALGTSGGGIPAVLASIALGFDRGVSVCGRDFHDFASKLPDSGVNAEPYAALLASRQRPFPELVLVYGADNRGDAAAANALAKLVPSRLSEVENCAEHTVLAWALTQGRLPALMTEVLGQSVESGDRVAKTHGQPHGQSG
ncbi:MAG: hypothetical protein GZ089_08870 [Aromatoleum sp.]|nr:hypothetical protein [Aromatoleum sp.]